MSKSAKEIVHLLPKRFKKEAAKADYASTFHIVLEGDKGGEFTVKIENQECTVDDGLHGEPDCVVKSKDEIYEKIESGEMNAQMAVMMGKVKISNLGEMMTFMGLFDTNKA